MNLPEARAEPVASTQSRNRVMISIFLFLTDSASCYAFVIQPVKWNFEERLDYYSLATLKPKRSHHVLLILILFLKPLQF